MESKGILFVIFLLIILTSCSNIKQQKNVSLTINHSDSLPTGAIVDTQIQKTIKLDSCFEIKIGRKEEFVNFTTYTLFILTHKNKTIYRDTSITEYEFGDTLYPILRSIDNSSQEILVEVNDRPNKNYLKYFRVYQGNIVQTEKFPTFISHAANLDTDNNLEYAGFWDWGETWGDNGSMTTYNPIIYYELKPSGIFLDSVLTVEKNTDIYGTFYGFSYNEKAEIKTNRIERMNKEIGRIRSSK